MTTDRPIPAVRRRPSLDKRVIHLEQNAASELYKVESGTRRAGAPHEDFWRELNARTQRLLRLQQAVFPDSDLHLHETTVFKDAEGLRMMMERFNGDVSFVNSDRVGLKQTCAFADAYIGGHAAPQLDFGVDVVLEQERNIWLPVFSIHARSDYSWLAPGLRTDRDVVEAAIGRFTDRWRRQRPSFDDVLQEELKAFGRNHKEGYEAAVRRIAEARDGRALLGLGHPIVLLHMELMDKFQRTGCDDAEARRRIYEFWDWPALHDQPVHRISSYLYAALARKIVGGQTRPPSRGMMTDIAAIATYGPYVDTMFVDNECAAFLRERPLCDEVKLKAKIFSLNTRQEFLSYLAELEAATPAEVRAMADEIYGTGI